MPNQAIVEILFQSIRTRDEAKIGTITNGMKFEDDEIFRFKKVITKDLITTRYLYAQFKRDKLIKIYPR